MRVVTGIVLFVLLLGHSFAQNYPTKPPKIVVGYPPGGSGDFTTRIIADELSKELGVTFVVENKPGAGGSIASEYVAKSAPDGYTILNQGNHAYNRVMYKDLSYSDKDFIPVSRVANGATLLVVGQNSQFQSLKELIAFAKANPGKLFNASAGFGSAPHVAACAFEAAAGIKITSVQFKGGGPAAQSLLAGDTQMMFATSPTVTGFIQAGRMRPFLVSIAKGSPSIPNLRARGNSAADRAAIARGGGQGALEARGAAEDRRPGHGRPALGLARGLRRRDSRRGARDRARPQGLRREDRVVSPGPVPSSKAPRPPGPGARRACGRAPAPRPG